MEGRRPTIAKQLRDIKDDPDAKTASFARKGSSRNVKKTGRVGAVRSRRGSVESQGSARSGSKAPKAPARAAGGAGGRKGKNLKKGGGKNAAKKRPVKERAAECAEELKMLEERNSAAGDPHDHATAELHKAQELVEEMVDLQQRIAISYNPTLVEKEFKHIVPKTEKQLKVTRDAITTRAFIILQKARTKLDGLRDRNEKAGNPQDEATVLLEEAEKVVTASEGVREEKDADDARVAKAKEDGDDKAEADFELTDRFIVATNDARIAVSKCGRAMTQRAFHQISGCEDTLEAARARYDQLAARNESQGDPDDEATKTLQKALQVVEAAEHCRELMWADPDSPELADDFIDATQPLTVSPNPLEEAEEALRKRAFAMVDKCQVAANASKERLAKLVARNEAAGSPDDEATAELHAAEEAVATIDETKAALDGKSLDDPEWNEAAAAFVGSVNTADEAMVIASAAFDVRDAALVEEAAAELELLRDRVTRLEERNKAAGQPDDDATSDLTAAMTALSGSLDWQSRVTDSSPDDDEDWGMHARSFINAVRDLAEPVEKAEKSMDDRDASSVEGARQLLDNCEADLLATEKRNDAVGAPEDEAGKLVTQARASFDHCKSKAEALESSDGPVDSERATEFKDAVSAAREAINAAMKAVKERQEKLVSDASSKLDEQRKALNVLLARNEAAEKPDDEGTSSLMAAVQKVTIAEAARERMRGDLNDDELDYAFLRAVADIGDVVTVATTAIETRETTMVTSVTSRCVAIRERLAALEARNMPEDGSEKPPDDSATAALAEAQKAVALAVAEEAALKEMLEGDTDKAAFAAKLRQLGEAVATAEKALDEAKSAFDTRDANNVGGATEELQEMTKVLLYAEGRNRAHGAPEDDAADLVRAARAAVDDATECKEENDAIVGEMTSEMANSYRSKVAAAAVAVGRGAKAINERERQLRAEAVALEDRVEKALTVLLERDNAAGSPEDAAHAPLVNLQQLAKAADDAGDALKVASEEHAADEDDLTAAPVEHIDTFLASISPLEPALAKATAALNDRDSAALDGADSQYDSVVALLESLERRVQAAEQASGGGAEVAEAASVATAREVLSTVPKLKEAIASIDRNEDPGAWTTAVYAFVAGVASAQSAVQEAKTELDGHDAAAVQAAGGSLAKLTDSLAAVEARNDARGAPDDAATALVRTARRSWQAATELNTALAGGSVDTARAEQLKAAAIKAVEDVEAARAAVAEREKRLIAERSGVLDAAIKAIPVLVARNDAADAHHDKLPAEVKELDEAAETALTQAKDIVAAATPARESLMAEDPPTDEAVDAFLGATDNLAAQLEAARTALHAREMAEKAELSEQLEAARKTFSSLQERQKASGSPDDEASSLLAAAAEVMGKVDGAEAALAALSYEESEEEWVAALDKFLHAASKATAATDKAESALDARDASSVTGARELFAATLPKVDALEVRDAASLPRDEVAASNDAAHAQVVAVRERASALSALQAELDAIQDHHSSEFSALSAKFMASVGEASTELAAANSAVLARENEQMSTAISSISAARATLAKYEERDVASGSPTDDAAAAALTAARDAVSKAEALRDVLREGANTPEAVAALIDSIAPMQDAIDAAGLALKEREAAEVDAAMPQFSHAQTELSALHRRALAAGAESGDASTQAVLSEVERLCEEAATLKAKLDALAETEGGMDTEEWSTLAHQYVKAVRAAEEATVRAVGMLGDMAANRVREAEAQLDSAMERFGIIERRDEAATAGDDSGEVDPVSLQVQGVAKMKAGMEALRSSRADGAAEDEDGIEYITQIKQFSDAVDEARAAVEKREAEMKTEVFAKLQELRRVLNELAADNRRSGFQDDDVGAGLDSAEELLHAAESKRDAIQVVIDRSLRAGIEGEEEVQLSQDIRELVDAADSAAEALATAQNAKERRDAAVAERDAAVDDLRRRLDAANVDLERMREASHTGAHAADTYDDVAKVLEKAEVEMREALTVRDLMDASPGTPAVVDRFIKEAEEALVTYESAKEAWEAREAALRDANARALRESIDDHAAKLKSAEEILAATQARNRAAGEPDDEATAKVQAAVEALERAKEAHAAIANTGPAGVVVPEVGEAFVAAATEALEAIDAAQEAVFQRDQAERLKWAASTAEILKAARAEVDRLVEQNTAAGTPHDKPTELLNAAVAEVAFAETCMAEMLAAPTDMDKALKFADSVSTASTGVAVAAKAIKRRGDKERGRLLRCKAALAAARKTLESLRVQNRHAGNPVDDASDAIDAATRAVIAAATVQALLEADRDNLMLGDKLAEVVDAATSAVAEAAGRLAVRGTGYWGPTESAADVLIRGFRSLAKAERTFAELEAQFGRMPEVADVHAVIEIMADAHAELTPPQRMRALVVRGGGTGKVPQKVMKKLRRPSVAVPGAGKAPEVDSDADASDSDEEARERQRMLESAATYATMPVDIDSLDRKKLDNTPSHVVIEFIAAVNEAERAVERAARVLAKVLDNGEEISRAVAKEREAVTTLMHQANTAYEQAAAAYREVRESALAGELPDMTNALANASQHVKRANKAIRKADTAVETFDELVNPNAAALATLLTAAVTAKVKCENAQSAVEDARENMSLEEQDKRAAQLKSFVLARCTEQLEASQSVLDGNNKHIHALLSDKTTMRSDGGHAVNSARDAVNAAVRAVHEAQLTVESSRTAGTAANPHEKVNLPLCLVNTSIASVLTATAARLTSVAQSHYITLSTAPDDALTPDEADAVARLEVAVCHLERHEREVARRGAQSSDPSTLYLGDTVLVAKRALRQAQQMGKEYHIRLKRTSYDKEGSLPELHAFAMAVARAIRLVGVVQWILTKEAFARQQATGIGAGVAGRMLRVDRHGRVRGGNVAHAGRATGFRLSVTEGLIKPKWGLNRMHQQAHKGGKSLADALVDTPLPRRSYSSEWAFNRSSLLESEPLSMSRTVQAAISLPLVKRMGDGTARQSWIMYRWLRVEFADFRARLRSIGKQHHALLVRMREEQMYVLPEDIGLALREVLVTANTALKEADTELPTRRQRAERPLPPFIVVQRFEELVRKANVCVSRFSWQLDHAMHDIATLRKAHIVFDTSKGAKGSNPRGLVHRHTSGTVGYAGPGGAYGSFYGGFPGYQQAGYGQGGLPAGQSFYMPHGAAAMKGGGGGGGAYESADSYATSAVASGWYGPQAGYADYYQQLQMQQAWAMQQAAQYAQADGRSSRSSRSSHHKPRRPHGDGRRSASGSHRRGRRIKHMDSSVTASTSGGSRAGLFAERRRTPPRRMPRKERLAKASRRAEIKRLEEMGVIEPTVETDAPTHYPATEEALEAVESSGRSRF